MKIENYGTGERCEQVMRGLLDSDARGEIPESITRIILLPIPSSKDRVHITGTQKLLCEVIARTAEGDAVIGYGISKQDKELIASHGAKVLDAAECEDFVRENARISALGALGYILTNLNRTPDELTFGIVGYGRIGSHLLRMLLFFGAKIVLFTSKELTRVELGALGIETRETDYKSPLDLSGIDVLINTAPTDLSSSFPSGITEGGMRVIELASGENFGGIKGIEKLPSIPDKLYPVSSARAYFEVIQNFLREVTE